MSSSDASDVESEVSADCQRNQVEQLCSALLPLADTSGFIQYRRRASDRPPDHLSAPPRVRPFGPRVRLTVRPTVRPSELPYPCPTVGPTVFSDGLFNGNSGSGEKCVSEIYSMCLCTTINMERMHVCLSHTHLLLTFSYVSGIKVCIPE